MKSPDPIDAILIEFDDNRHHPTNQGLSNEALEIARQALAKEVLAALPEKIVLNINATNDNVEYVRQIGFNQAIDLMEAAVRQRFGIEEVDEAEGNAA